MLLHGVDGWVGSQVWDFLPNKTVFYKTFQKTTEVKN